MASLLCAIYLPVCSCCDDLTLIWPVAYGVEHGVSKYHLAAHQLAASVQVYKDEWEKFISSVLLLTYMRSQMMHVPSVLAVTH